MLGSLDSCSGTSGSPTSGWQRCGLVFFLGHSGFGPNVYNQPVSAERVDFSILRASLVSALTNVTVESIFFFVLFFVLCFCCFVISRFTWEVSALCRRDSFGFVQRKTKICGRFDFGFLNSVRGKFRLVAYRVRLCAFYQYCILLELRLHSCCAYWA